MPFRSDITIDWSVNPRIIQVPSTSVEVTVQDLIDTIRLHEDDPVNLAYPTLIKAATGKQQLTTELLVGITLTLSDTLLAFEERLSPPTERCDVKGGNLLAVDDMDVSVPPILTTDFTQVVYDLSPAPTLVSGLSGSGGTRVSSVIFSE